MLRWFHFSTPAIYRHTACLPNVAAAACYATSPAVEYLLHLTIPRCHYYLPFYHHRRDLLFVILWTGGDLLDSLRLR